MNKSLQCLKDECSSRGIHLEKNTRYTIFSLSSLLTKHSLSLIDNPSYGLRKRCSIDNVMLCYSFSDLSKKEQYNIMHCEDWIAEPKYYGCRVITTYHPEEGFMFFGRGLDEETFLPKEYTDKVLIPHSKRTLPSDWKGVFNQPFVLDGELFSKSCLMKKSDRDVYVSMEGNYVSLLMESDKFESHDIQLHKFPLTYTAFDVLYFGNDTMWSSPLRTRKSLLRHMFSTNFQATLPFEEAPYVTYDKLPYLKEQLGKGMEGCVLKNMSKHYTPTPRRNGDVMVRVKPRSDACIEDLDVFVSDVKGSQLEVSVIVRDSCGFEKDRKLGTIQCPVSLRREAREPYFNQRFFQRPIPNPKIMGGVLTVCATGYDKSRSCFNNLKANWDIGFRRDKTRFDCIIDINSIEAKWLSRLA